MDNEQMRNLMTAAAYPWMDKSGQSRLVNQTKDPRKRKSGGLKIIDDPVKLKALEQLKKDIADKAN